MSSTMYSCKSQSAIIALDIACNLLAIHVGDVVGAPLINDGPAEISQPALSSIGGDGTIGISGVLQNLVFALELYIYPLRSILKRSVIQSVAAQVPLSRLILNVQLLSYKRVIEVIKDRTTINAGRNLLQVSVLIGMLSTEPSVLRGSERST